MLAQVAREVNGTTVSHFNGHDLDWSNFQRLSMREAIIQFWPENAGTKPQMSDFSSYDALHALLSSAVQSSSIQGTGWREKRMPQESPRLPPNLPRGTGGSMTKEQQSEMNTPLRLNAALKGILAEMENGGNFGRAVATLFETFAEGELIQPTFIYDFPLAISPLSKNKREPEENADWVERFEIFVGGLEIGNAFSELNDPEEQRRRFEEQLGERARGDEEAHQMDEDYIRALSYGLPPAAGEGVGIDRLTMLLTDSRSIRDVILFPLLRPLKREEEDELDSAAEPPAQN